MDEVERAERWVRRRVVNKLAEVLALAAGEDDADFRRASGDSSCAWCGEPYYRHAVDPLSPGRSLVLLCSGERVKL